MEKGMPVINKIFIMFAVMIMAAIVLTIIMDSIAESNDPIHDAHKLCVSEGYEYIKNAHTPLKGISDDGLKLIAECCKLMDQEDECSQEECAWIRIWK